MYKKYLFEQDETQTVDELNNQDVPTDNGDTNDNSNSDVDDDNDDDNDDDDYESNDDKILARENGEYADNNDELDKALTLMKQAVKQYQDGKFDLARHTRILANKSFQKVDAEMDTEEGREKTLYGENKNFGLIYKVLEENANKMYSGKTNILPYAVKMIKEDKILKDQFDLYEAFISPKNVKNTKEYVNEVINLIKRHNKKDIRESNTKLIRLLKKSKYVNEDIYVDKKEMLLFEAIEYAFMNKKSIKNINQYAKVNKILCEAVNRNNKNINKRTNIGAIYETKLNSIVNKYSKSLNEAEKNLIMEYNKSNNKKALFEQMKEETLNSLKNKLPDCDSQQVEEINEIIAKINNLPFDENKCIQNIALMANIKNEII